MRKLANYLIKIYATVLGGYRILEWLPDDKFICVNGSNHKKISVMHRVICKIARYSKYPDSIWRSVTFNCCEEFKMYLDVNEFTQCGYYFDPPDPGLIVLIQRGGRGFVDIGANVGFFSLLASKNFDFVHGFEVSNHTRRLLMNNLEMNSINNVVVYDKGLSDVSGSVTLYHNPFNNGGASLEGGAREVMERDASYVWSAEDVKVDRLDNLIKSDNRGIIDFIKIDVEGHELSVIRGGEETIRLYRPLIYAEVSKSVVKVKEIINTLPGLYVPYSLIDKRIIGEGGDVPDDVLFIPSEKVFEIKEVFEK